MKHLISLLAFSFLIGCDGEKSNEPTNPNLKYEIKGDTVTITGCDKKASGELIIAAKIEGKPVTSIGKRAFLQCYSLTSITIPDSVTSIGDAAFASCTSLTSITIGNGVTSIGKSAFYKCRSLTSITIPDSVTSIENAAFFNCTSLTSITIGDGVTSIEITAFMKCTSMTKIEVSMDNMNYTDVEGVLFNRGKTLLNTYPANKAGANYVIPDSVTSIGDGAFAGCGALTSITIPDDVTSIGESAFVLCSSLTSITIPDSVTSIGDAAFGGCTSMTKIEVGVENVNYANVSGVLFNKDKTLLHAYPAGKAGANYVIPDSVTSIGRYAFEYCGSLKSITIPDSVISIGDGAFGLCTSLTAVTFLGDAPKIENDAFKKSSPTIYRKADAKGWSDTLAGRPVKLITEKP